MKNTYSENTANLGNSTVNEREKFDNYYNELESKVRPHIKDLNTWGKQETSHHQPMNTDELLIKFYTVMIHLCSNVKALDAIEELVKEGIEKYDKKLDAASSSNAATQQTKDTLKERLDTYNEIYKDANTLKESIIYYVNNNSHPSSINSKLVKSLAKQLNDFDESIKNLESDRLSIVDAEWNEYINTHDEVKPAHVINDNLRSALDEKEKLTQTLIELTKKTLSLRNNKSSLDSKKQEVLEWVQNLERKNINNVKTLEKAIESRVNIATIISYPKTFYLTESNDPNSRYGNYCKKYRELSNIIQQLIENTKKINKTISEMNDIENLTDAKIDSFKKDIHQYEEINIAKINDDISRIAEIGNILTYLAKESSLNENFFEKADNLIKRPVSYQYQNDINKFLKYGKEKYKIIKEFEELLIKTINTDMQISQENKEAVSYIEEINDYINLEKHVMLDMCECFMGNIKYNDTALEKMLDRKEKLLSENAQNHKKYKITKYSDTFKELFKIYSNKINDIKNAHVRRSHPHSLYINNLYRNNTYNTTITKPQRSQSTRNNTYNTTITKPQQSKSTGNNRLSYA
ncbi:MAG: hypothetical protein K5769_02620 [Pseudobutyrivibrio sp.]|nr:hypothetical protein [Pseudobutyrivibrio sp.]